jgi:phage tail-like protein
MPTKSSASSLPLVGTHFSVDFGTNQVIKEHSFSEIDIPNLEFKTNGENAIIYGQKELHPDGFEFGDLVLKRGKTSKDSYLFKWLKIQIDFQRKLPIQIVVKLLNHEHSPFLKWTFLNAFPIKFDTSGISSTSKDVMLDSITFKFESFNFEEIGEIGSVKIENPLQGLEGEKGTKWKNKKVKKEPVKLKSENKTKRKTPVKIKNDEYALAKNALRLARQVDGMLQKKPLKISPPKPKSSRINRKTSRKKPPK